MYLHTGWDKFARDLALEPGCQPHLPLRGGGEMIVKVFDDSACRHYHTDESGSDTDKRLDSLVNIGDLLTFNFGYNDTGRRARPRSRRGMERIVHIHHVDKDAFLKGNIEPDPEEVDLVFDLSPSIAEVAQVRVELNWNEPNDGVELEGRNNVGFGMHTRWKTMCINSEQRWSVYKETVDRSQDKALELFATKTVDARIELDLNRPSSPVQERSPPPMSQEEATQSPIAQQPSLENEYDEHDDGDDGFEMNDNNVGDLDNYWTQEEMDHSIPYSRCYASDSDDDGTEEEVDEDGLTAKEAERAEIFKKVTGRDIRVPLFRDVSLADGVVVDGGKILLLGARMDHRQLTSEFIAYKLSAEVASLPTMSIRYQEETSIARGGEEKLDMKKDVKPDMELDMKLDMKKSHGRAREEREACARGEDEVSRPRPGQTAATRRSSSGPIGRHADPPGNRRSLTATGGVLSHPPCHPVNTRSKPDRLVPGPVDRPPDRPCPSLSRPDLFGPVILYLFDIITWREFEALRNEMRREFRAQDDVLNGKVEEINQKLDATNTTITTMADQMTDIQRTLRTLTMSVENLNQQRQQNEDADEAPGRGDRARGWAPLGRNGRGQDEEDGLGKPKFSIPKFEGGIDVEEYLTWELKTEKLWGLHPHYTEDRKIKLASSKFDGYALRWWDRYVSAREEDGELPIITWRAMKAAMTGRFVPTNYLRNIFDKLTLLRQGVKIVDEYYMEMEMLMQRGRVKESLEMTMTRFLNFLKYDIKGIVCHYSYTTMNELLHHAREAESQLADEAKIKGRASGAGRFTPRAPPPTAPAPSTRSAPYSTPSSKPVSNASNAKKSESAASTSGSNMSTARNRDMLCHTCGGKGHFKRDCPDRKVMIINEDNEYETGYDVDPNAPDDDDYDTDGEDAYTSDARTIVVS
ncbi:hypothetical protein QYE76_036371 [Lolium multiflorum]|uniref:CCHC-type domain-containing protein n=1 Tax=Lolium multiflorum TaxID=4521 RepID=A0AAD8R0V3_LOLMU|nr:hypothetical protein QYE76_036371 [Lolium multiflorum]